jgi:hypothetical protein
MEIAMMTLKGCPLYPLAPGDKKKSHLTKINPNVEAILIFYPGAQKY